ncbi:hypothetical protein PAMA111031_05985 [Paraphotobacterium marinum]
MKNNLIKGILIFVGISFLSGCVVVDKRNCKHHRCHYPHGKIVIKN